MPEDAPSASSAQGILWKIDRNAIHDGPGLRMALYFKGCPLRCRWCSNPEGQSDTPVLIFQGSKCNNCGLCIETCPADALEQCSPGKVGFHRSRCNGCGDCLVVCPSEALQVWGRRYTVEEVLQLLEKDRVIHKRSGGGVTCTGGEPLEQGEFLLELLGQCRRRGIHTVVETSAYADERIFRRMLEVVDWLFVDIKHVNPQRHFEITGRNNQLILSNVGLASAVLKDRGKDLVIRQIIVPGMTDGQNIIDLGEFVTSLPFVTGVEVLPYHIYGIHKYDLLGLTYGLREIGQVPAEEIERHKALLREKGLRVIE